MIRKSLNIASWFVLIIGIILLCGFSKRKQHTKTCKDLRIQVDHSSGNFFVDEEDIFRMVYHEVDTVLGKALKDINSAHLEHKIRNHPAIQNTEVYKTIDGEVVIEVKQRTPIVRLFAFNGDSYYIDSTGKVMPPSSNYAARVMIANGFIYDDYVDVNHYVIKDMEEKEKASTMVDDIFKMAEYIRKDPLWAAQIEQLYVNKDLEIELIPRVGNHRIVFGEATSIKEKFNKLKIFYQEGLDKTGWNEYSIINLKYANQVVCTKE